MNIEHSAEVFFLDSESCVCVACVVCVPVCVLLQEKVGVKV